MNALFVTGIGTDVGKTVVSAILTQALGAGYWKPIQCGDLHFSDTDKVRSLVTNPHCVFFPERYRLMAPLSPHQAAPQEGRHIRCQDFLCPSHPRPLIIEGAGGLMVPLNGEETILDLIKTLQVPVVLVSKNYLGSLNHTLLTTEMLSREGIKIQGLIFNGRPNEEGESLLLQKTGLKCLGRILEEANITTTVIEKYAREWLSSDALIHE